MKKLLWLLLLTPCFAQVAPQIQGAGAPSNPCATAPQQYVDTTNHVIYQCNVSGGNWVNIGLGSPTNASIAVSASDPATCSTTPNIGELALYYNTASNSLKVCSATNTWSAVGGANPAGSGSEVQFRSNPTTLGAVTGSSVSGSSVTFTGSVTAAGFTSTAGGTASLDLTTGACSAGSAGTVRFCSNTGDVPSVSIAGAAVVGLPTLAGDLGGTAASPQAINAHFTTNPSLGTVGPTVTVANAGATGTTVNLLAKINASGQAVLPATTDTGIPMAGICSTSDGGVCGTSGSANLVVSGIAPCVADGTVTTGDSIGVGTSTAGRCKSLAAAGTAPAAGLTVVGVAMASATVGNTFNVLLSPEAAYPAAVSSVFSRTGAVVATSGDYTTDKIGSPAATTTWSSAFQINVQSSSASVTPLKVNTTQGTPTAALFAVTDSSNNIKLAVDSKYHTTDIDNIAVLTSDFTDSSGSAALQNITGLSFNLPQSVAQNIPIECHYMFSQATNVSDQFGIQFGTNAPTRADFRGQATLAGPGANFPTYGVLANLTSTTATAIVTFTPTATTTNYADIYGVMQMPSSAGSGTVQMMVQQSTAADVIVIKAGSYCKIW